MQPTVNILFLESPFPFPAPLLFSHFSSPSPFYACHICRLTYFCATKNNNIVVASHDFIGGMQGCHEALAEKEVIASWILASEHTVINPPELLPKPAESFLRYNPGVCHWNPMGHFLTKEMNSKLWLKSFINILFLKTVVMLDGVCMMCFAVCSFRPGNGLFTLWNKAVHDLKKK